MTVRSHGIYEYGLKDANSKYLEEAGVPAKLLVSRSRSCSLKGKSRPSRPEVAVAVRPSKEDGKYERMDDTYLTGSEVINNIEAAKVLP